MKVRTLSKQKVALWINNTENGNVTRILSLKKSVRTDQLLLQDVATAIQTHFQ